MASLAIEAVGLTKSYGDVHARRAGPGRPWSVTRNETPLGMKIPWNTLQLQASVAYAARRDGVNRSVRRDGGTAAGRRTRDERENRKEIHHRGTEDTEDKQKKRKFTAETQRRRGQTGKNFMGATRHE